LIALPNNGAPSTPLDALPPACVLSLSALVDGSAVFPVLLALPKLKPPDEAPKLGAVDGLGADKPAGADEDVGKADAPKADLKGLDVEEAPKLNPPALGCSFGGSESFFPSDCGGGVPKGLLLESPKAGAVEGLLNGNVGGFEFVLAADPASKGDGGLPWP